MMAEAVGYLVLAVAALRLSWIDCRCFVIEYETLAVMGLVVVSLIWLSDGVLAVLGAATVSATTTLSMACLVWLRWLRKPGAGDWALMFMCVLAGSRCLPVFAVTLAFAGIGTAVTYAVRRNRPVFRSRFPLAPPITAAAVVSLAFSDIDFSGAGPFLRTLAW